jgi:hypothetical protein
MQMVVVPSAPSEHEVKFFQACLTGNVEDILGPSRVGDEQQPPPEKPSGYALIADPTIPLRNPTRRRFAS